MREAWRGLVRPRGGPDLGPGRRRRCGALAAVTWRPAVGSGRRRAEVAAPDRAERGGGGGLTCPVRRRDVRRHAEEEVRVCTANISEGNTYI